jgi:hypothetical protein
METIFKLILERASKMKMEQPRRLPDCFDENELDAIEDLGHCVFLASEDHEKRRRPIPAWFSARLDPQTDCGSTELKYREGNWSLVLSIAGDSGDQ